MDETAGKLVMLQNIEHPIDHTRFFIRNLAQGLVLKVPHFRASSYQILILKVP